MSAKTHVVIPTHTTRHLHRTLLGYATQDQAPTTITVSCDTDDQAIGRLLEAVVAETGLTITQVFRARHPEARLAQNRNNGIRSLLRRGLAEDDLLAFAKARLAGFKRPKTVVFGPLPKTSTGKIQKFQLRERAKAL